MIFISHRGNLYGKNKNEENHPDYIKHALSRGYDVEIDIWYKNGSFFLGHDEPNYKIKKSFLNNSKFWCHAKNAEAFYELSKIKSHYFWHQKDDYTLTSKGFMWVYPKKKYFKNSIVVLTKKTDQLPKNCYGVCSDFVGNYND